MRTLFSLPAVFGIVVLLGLFAAPTASLAFDEPCDDPECCGEFACPRFSLGGGVAWFYLPDVTNLTIKNGAGTTIRKRDTINDLGSAWGGTFNGSLLLPLNGPRAISISGFWAGVSDDSTRHCLSSPDAICSSVNIVDDPFDLNSIDRVFDKFHTSRDVDNWGTQIEGRHYFGTGGTSGLVNLHYFGVGFDVRGIDQTLRTKATSGFEPSASAVYNETLDTTYWGGFLSAGGEYSLFPNLSSSLGLRSFFSAHVGVYGATTDYSGRYNAQLAGFDDFGRLNLSEEQAAVIAGVSFETRKRIGPRTSLSLLTDYEYYSYAPEMRYNDTDIGGCGGTCDGNVTGTKIADDDAFAIRTSLRFNIGLGPDKFYQPRP